MLQTDVFHAVIVVSKRKSSPVGKKSAYSGTVLNNQQTEMLWPRRVTEYFWKSCLFVSFCNLIFPLDTTVSCLCWKRNENLFSFLINSNHDSLSTQQTKGSF